MSAHPNPPPSHSQSYSNKRPLPPHPISPPIPPKMEYVLIRDFPEDGVFFRVFYRNLALLYRRVLLLLLIILLQNKHTTLACYRLTFFSYGEQKS